MLCFPFYDLSALAVSFGFSWHCLASIGKKVKEIMRKKCFSVYSRNGFLYSRGHSINCWILVESPPLLLT